MLLSDPVLNRMFESARMNYRGVFALPRGNGFTVPFMKDETEHVVRIRLTRRNNFAVRIPKEIVLGNLISLDRNTHIIWRMQGDKMTVVRNYPNHILASTRANYRLVETKIAHVLANVKEQGDADDSDDEVHVTIGA